MCIHFASWLFGIKLQAFVLCQQNDENEGNTDKTKIFIFAKKKKRQKSENTTEQTKTMKKWIKKKLNRRSYCPWRDVLIEINNERREADKKIMFISGVNNKRQFYTVRTLLPFVFHLCFFRLFEISIKGNKMSKQNTIYLFTWQFQHFFLLYWTSRLLAVVSNT